MVKPQFPIRTVVTPSSSDGLLNVSFCTMKLSNPEMLYSSPVIPTNPPPKVMPT